MEFNLEPKWRPETASRKTMLLNFCWGPLAALRAVICSSRLHFCASPLAHLARAVHSLCLYAASIAFLTLGRSQGARGGLVIRAAAGGLEMWCLGSWSPLQMEFNLELT